MGYPQNTGGGETRPSVKHRKPEMYQAHKTFTLAVKHGRLQRGTTCEQCGSDRHINGHHDDYSKPLEVRWLCGSCHTKHHWALRKASQQGAAA